MNADPAYAEGGRRGLKKLEAEAAVEEGTGADSARLLGFARHFDDFDKQLDNIKRFGPSYLALQSFGRTSENPTPEG